MPRTVKAPDERRGELIACAQDLFFSRGYESTSIRDIVDRAGVAKGTFYYYFDSKQEIVEAMVNDMSMLAVGLLRGIIDNQDLDATQKWIQGMQVVGNWKTENKEKLISLLRVLHTDENAVLRQEILTSATELIAPELTRIASQGVEEGQFDTEYVEEAGELAVALMNSLSEMVYDVLLRPDDNNGVADLLRRKLAAVQTAIERLLGAAPGSLPIMDDGTFRIWFEEPQGARVEKIR